MASIDTSAFEARVAEQGYEVFRRTLGPSEGLGDHAHDYDVWGLVISGEFRITVEGTTTRYREGEEFLLEAGCAHSESAGTQGCSFLVGRRTTPCRRIGARCRPVPVSRSRCRRKA